RYRRWASERMAECFQKQVVVLAVTHVEADSIRKDADDEPATEQRLANVLWVVEGYEQEVRPRRQRIEPKCSQRACQTVSLFDLFVDVGRVGKARERERGR